MLILRRCLRSSREPYSTLRRHAIVWPQMLAALCIILQPLPVSRAIYVPGDGGNPYWQPLSGSDPEPSGGPDMSDADGSGTPAWLAQFNGALQSGMIVWWGGAQAVIDGQWQQLPGRYHAPAGDSDSDGLPDSIDPYPGDTNNNSFHWNGGTFVVNDALATFASGYYRAPGSDGMPTACRTESTLIPAIRRTGIRRIRFTSPAELS